MATRGEATRARLIEAALRVVREVGYAHASTRAIAAAAGVAEGTIYRHFPDKPTLLFAAVLDSNAPVVAWVSTLPERAGQGTVEGNLVDALTRLATLRDQVLPLELAIMADPELAAHQRRVFAESVLAGDGAESGRLPLAPLAPQGPGLPTAIPDAIARYLAEEQRLDRVRADLDPVHAALVLLVMLFGLMTLPLGGAAPGPGHIGAAVGLLMRGLEAR